MRKGEDVRVRIRNEGSLDLKNITLLIKYAGVLVGTPYRVTIPFIAAGDEAEAVFRVQAGLDTLTIRLECPNGYSEEETVSVSIDKAASVDVRCLFPERRVDLGSKTSFPIWLVNKGGAGIYTFKVKGLPSSIDYRFIRDDVEVGAVYLEEGGQAMIALETVIPSIPVNFTVGEVIDFYVNVFTEDGELAGSARLKLIPVISRGLRAYSNAWYGKMLTTSQNIHYPGVPYSTGLLFKGSSVAAIFRLDAGVYTFLLYGSYVGSRCDLNLYLLDLSGKPLAVSANDSGKPELIILSLDKPTTVLTVVANEEATSSGDGEGIILVTKTIVPPDELELSISNPIFQDCVLIRLPSSSGGMLSIKVDGGSGEMSIYRFTTNKDRMSYDPFIPGGYQRTVFNGSTNIDYWVMRGDNMVLLTVKARMETHIRVKCAFSEELKVSTGLYERDIAVATAILVTAVMVLMVLKEKLVKPRG